MMIAHRWERNLKDVGDQALMRVEYRISEFTGSPANRRGATAAGNTVTRFVAGLAPTPAVRSGEPGTVRLHVRRRVRPLAVRLAGRTTF